MKKIKKIFFKICTFVGLVTIISSIVSLIGSSYFSKAVEIKENTALTINFSDNFTETPSNDFIDEIMGQKSSDYLGLIEAIEFAAIDDNITAIVARIDVTGLDLAQVEEVAAALEDFKKTGKKTYVYSQGFGPFGQGNREYYLASFFDEIYMQPHTHIGLTGISMEIPFARNVLNKIGVMPEFYMRHEYKSAMMSMTDDKISPEYKENMTSLTNSLVDMLLFDISHKRKIKNLHNIMDKAPISAEEGLKLGLVDELMYMPEFEQKIKQKGIKHFISVQEYRSNIFYNNDNDDPFVAILQLNGVINTGKSSSDFDGEFVTGSEDVLSDIDEIRHIKNLKALVVRVNSPGGSYTAADEIYQALMKLKADKKIPIVISQGGYAASGGYFVSLAGDYIMTQPMTITGSIGVLGGKFVLRDLWQKLGINWTEIKNGANADILSMNRPFSSQERKIFNASLDEVYADFTAKVMERRHLNKPIDEVARGRVWTGADALFLGLIDGLGGYNEALGKAKEMSNIKPGDKFSMMVWPRQKTFREKIRELIMSSKVNSQQMAKFVGVDIRYLKLFKRLQYDTVLLPFYINM